MNNATHPFECEEVMAFLDGELSPEHAAAVAAHIESCVDCAVLEVELKTLTQTTQSWSVDWTASQLSLEAVLPAEQTRKSTRSILFGFPWKDHPRRAWLWTTAAATTFVFLIAAVVVHNILRPAEFKHSSTPSQTALYSPPPPSVSASPPNRGRSQESLSVSKDAWGAARDNRLSFGSALGEKNEFTGLIQTGPMIARGIALAIVCKNFSASEQRVREIVARHGGYIGQLTVATPTDSAKQLAATLRIPARHMDAALADIKSLGRVEKESQSAEDVSGDHRDLVARISNARRSEQRLLDILANRTGKLADVIEAEEKISAVREEIERMEAQRKDLEKRVAYATLELQLAEEFKAQLEVTPPSSATRLRNAIVEGYKDATGSLFSLAVLVMQVGPVLLLWAAILFFPARFAWRRFRRAVQFAEQRL